MLFYAFINAGKSNLQQERLKRFVISPRMNLKMLSLNSLSALVTAYQVSENVQDHGVDVIVYDGKGEKWVVQCKVHRGVVGEPVLRDLLGAMLHERATRAFLMTTGTISQKAREWIVDKPILVYESEGLVRLLQCNSLDGN